MPDSPEAGGWPTDIETSVLRAIREHDVVTATACVDAIATSLAPSTLASRRVAARLSVLLERIRQEVRRSYGLDSGQLPRPGTIADRLSTGTLPQALDSFVSIAHRILRATDTIPHATIAERARRYIDQRYTQPDTNVESTATALHCSAGHLIATFGAAYGVPPGTYLRNRRVRHAKRLLGNPSLQIQEVAYRCGYESPDGFSRAFKTVTGLSPSDFRAAEGSSITGKQFRETTDRADHFSDA